MVIEIDRSQSPDGRYCAVFQQIGESDFPSGYFVELILTKDGEETEKRQSVVNNNQNRLTAENWSVIWQEKQVLIYLKGERHELEFFSMSLSSD